MTANEEQACVICMNDFDTASRQTVALPCGHNFCLTCLVRLKASESPVCPQCRQSFAEIELPGLSRMAKASGKSNFMTKGELAGCKVHKEPFVYWSTRSNELYCTICILGVDINTSCLKRISDAIPLIRDNLENKAQAVKEGITSDLENHIEERKKAEQELAKLNSFEKSIRKLKADYQQFIEKVDSHNSKLRKQSNSVHKIEEQISEIQGEEDIEIVLSYMETLEGLHKTFACSNHQMQHMMRPAKLLSDIANVFEEGEGQDAAFIQKLQQKMQRRNNRSGSATPASHSVHMPHGMYGNNTSGLAKPASNSVYIPHDMYGNSTFGSFTQANPSVHMLHGMFEYSQSVYPSNSFH